MAGLGACSREQTVLAGGAIMTTLHGTQPGPTLALVGGVHGDEDEGVLAVFRILETIASAPLVGTVRAIAPANPYAWAAHSRNGPLDGADLARSFPGQVDDGLTFALAAAITGNVIDGSDLLIDLHSAGLRYRMPLFCGFASDSPAAGDSRRAALAFGAPIVWEHPHSSEGRSLSAARDRGIAAIYAECSGGGSIRRHELDAYVAGVLAVMADFGMLANPIPPRDRAAKSRYVYGAGNLDAGAQSNHAGLFVSTTCPGAIVKEDQQIGDVYDYSGRFLDRVAAPHAGMVMFLRRQARIRVGDVLFALAHLDHEQD